MLGVSEMTLYRAIHERTFRAVRIMGRLIVPLHASELAAAAIEDGVLVDAADWVDPATEESRPAHVDGARDLPAGGTPQRHGVLVTTPTDWQATGSQSAGCHGAMRRPLSGRTSR